MTLQERLRDTEWHEHSTDEQRDRRYEAADAIDAKDARIKRLEEALRGLSSEAEELDYKFLSANDVKVERAIISAEEWQSVIAALRRARAALEDK